MILYSQRIGRLVLEDKPFSSGGAGEVFRAHDSAGAVYCVKKLLKPKPGEFDKIRHMADNPPKVVKAGWGQLCWPLDLVVDRAINGTTLGYVMPMARPGSVELSNVTNLRWPGKNPPPLAQKLDRSTAQGLARRMYAACNITAAVHEIHKLGCVFVDLKPQNILIAPDGSISMVDLDSLQIKAGTRVFHGPLGSPEYMPSESYRMNFGTMPVIDPSWDRFSLAVIIYEILLGIHPFTATAKATVIGCETIEDSIRFKMYVHGNNRGNLESIPPPHDGITALPKELADLFKKTFDAVNPSQRPATHEWGETLKNAATGGAPALSKKIYAPKQPTPAGPKRAAVARRTVQTAAAPAASPSSAMMVCFGPPTGPCPGGPYRQAVYGAPNFNLRGRPCFLCPKCIGSYASIPSSTYAGPPFVSPNSSRCWGPGTRVCPHQGRSGLPNYHRATGSSVYLCSDCLVEQQQLDAAANNPDISASSSDQPGKGCGEVIGGIFAIIFWGFIFIGILRSCSR